VLCGLVITNYKWLVTSFPCFVLQIITHGCLKRKTEPNILANGIIDYYWLGVLQSDDYGVLRLHWNGVRLICLFLPCYQCTSYTGACSGWQLLRLRTGDQVTLPSLQQISLLAVLKRLSREKHWHLHIDILTLTSSADIFTLTSSRW